MAMRLYLFICHPNPIPKQPSSYYNVAIFSPPFIFFGQGHFSSIFCGFQQQVLLVGLVFWTRGLPIFENFIIFHFTPFGGSLILLFTFCTLSILIYVTWTRRVASQTWVLWRVQNRYSLILPIFDTKMKYLAPISLSEYWVSDTGTLWENEKCMWHKF